MGVLSNINYIKQAWKVPCHFNTGGLDELDIVISTGIRAAIPVLFSVNQFSCMDIIKARAGISWKCGRALKAVIRSAHTAQAVDTSRFWYSITGAELTERLLWYWFVADLATEFVANWTSLMYEEIGCKLPYSGTLTTGVEVRDYLGDSTPRVVVPSGNVSNECATIAAGGIHVNEGCEVQIALYVNWQLCHGYTEGSNPTVVLVQRSTGKVFDQSGTWQSTGATGNASIIAYDRAGGGIFGEDYDLLVYTDGDPSHCAEAMGGNVNVTTYGRKVEFAPVGCTPKKASFSGG